MVSLLQTLTTFVSESRDRERCLLRRLDELSAQIVELKAEVRVSLEKNSAITAVDSSSELPGSTVRFPTAKESWKACVFVGNLNIWAHAKSHRFWDFPTTFCVRKNVVLDRIPVTSQWLFVGAVCILEFYDILGLT